MVFYSIFLYVLNDVYAFRTSNIALIWIFNESQNNSKILNPFGLF